MTKPYIHNDCLAKALAEYVKAERSKAKLSNQEICVKLAKEFGVVQTPENLKNKINRGNFGAQLFIMVMAVLGVEHVSVEEINRIYARLKEAQ